jgi:hypothetical protein
MDDSNSNKRLIGKEHNNRFYFCKGAPNNPPSKQLYLDSTSPRPIPDNIQVVS